VFLALFFSENLANSREHFSRFIIKESSETVKRQQEYETGVTSTKATACVVGAEKGDARRGRGTRSALAISRFGACYAGYQRYWLC